jgi:uncharacterized protein YaaN involved in tellurite resistance
VPDETAAPTPNTEGTQPVAPSQPKTVALATMPPEYLAVAHELAEEIDAHDARCMLAFGMKPQNMLSSATKMILGTSKTSAESEAQGTLGKLLRTLRDAETASEPGAIGKLARRIPGMGGRAGEARRIVGAYEPIAEEIDAIEAKLHEQQMTLLTDYENLEAMFAENADFIEQLSIYIAAGQLKLDELKLQLEAMRAASGEKGDLLGQQACDDCVRAIDRLSQRVYDLELTRLIAVQTGPQIRLIQDGDERLATRIQTAVLTTIPLWKRQVALAISLAHQKEALGNVTAVTDTTNGLLRNDAEALKRGTLDVRAQTERGMVDVDTLQATTDKLISTVEDALRISAEGRAKRAEGEKQVAEMEARIKAMLADQRGGIEAF